MAEKSVVLYDNCHYPNPPKRYTHPVEGSETIGDLKKKTAELTGYKLEAIEFSLQNNQLLDDETKTLEGVGLAQKLVIHIRRKSGSTDEDFPKKQEELRHLEARMEQMQISKPNEANEEQKQGKLLILFFVLKKIVIFLRGNFGDF